MQHVCIFPMQASESHCVLCLLSICRPAAGRCTVVQYWQAAGRAGSTCSTRRGQAKKVAGQQLSAGAHRGECRSVGRSGGTGKQVGADQPWGTREEKESRRGNLSYPVQSGKINVVRRFQHNPACCPSFAMGGCKKDKGESRSLLQ